jgi:sodium-dependent phosphate cotransporter
MKLIGETEIQSTFTKPAVWTAWVQVFLLIFFLLVAVDSVGNGFKLATAGKAKQLFDFASNPLVALIIGLASTALIQSSSTVTSIIVGLVAGGMPLSIAIPMIMGANIGTSLTSTIVSLGHIANKDEFKRAFSAATVHDSFNILAVLILLPVELLFHPIERISAHFSNLIFGGFAVGANSFNPVSFLIAPASNLMSFLVSFLPAVFGGIILIASGVALILLVVNLLGKVLKKVMVGRAQSIMQNTIGRGSLAGIGAGGIITVLVQSSSTTTSLIVPMAGNGLFTIRQVYPFVLGGNVGTTITALLAATAISGSLAILSLQIALVHFFFNLFAIFLIYFIPLLRNIPVFMAETLATYALKSKIYVLGYILGLFFIIPLALIGISSML